MVSGGNPGGSRGGGRQVSGLERGGPGTWEGATLGGAHGGETTFPGPPPPPTLKVERSGGSGKP
jgi:hypothetical protein